MKLKKFLDIKRQQRRDFLYGAGTLIALPFFESLYCNNLYAQNTAPLRVLCGLIWTGVDQVNSSGKTSYAHQNVLNLFSALSDQTVFYTGVSTRARGGTHPPFVQEFGHGGPSGKNSFDQYALSITGEGSLKGALALGLGSATNQSKYRISKKNGNSQSVVTNLNSALSQAVKLGGGVLTSPGGSGGAAVTLDKPTRLKKISLDYVVESIKTLQRKLSPTDKILLDEHLSHIENIESSLPRDPSSQPEASPSSPAQSACQNISGVSNSVDWLKRHDLMANIIAQAFICDSRRSISIVGNDCRDKVGYQNFPQFNLYKQLLEWIRQGNVQDQAQGGEDHTYPDYHLTTHAVDSNAGLKNAIASRTSEPGRNAEEKAENYMRKVRGQIDLLNIGFYKQIADKLKNTQDVNGKSVLDNSLLYFGGDMSDAQQHNADNIFTVTVGKAGGRINTQKQYVDLKGQPIPAFQNALLRALGHSGNDLYSHMGAQASAVNPNIFKG